MNDSPLSQFVSFYPDALLYLSGLGDIALVDVFFALCKHVDAFGGCDPGDERLGVVSKHRKDAIPALLERLQCIDYLHIIRTGVPYRQKPLRGFQVSPYVLRLRVEHQSIAVTNWQRFNPQTNASYENQTMPITFPSSDLQPESDPEPALKPDPEVAPRPARESKTSAFGAVQDDPLKKVGQGQGQGQKQRAAPPDRTSHGDESTLFRREPRSLLAYAGALPNAHAEQLAVNLKSIAADLSLPNARMLTDVYGVKAVNAVMQEFWARGDTPIFSPARWVRKVIRRMDVEQIEESS